MNTALVPLETAPADVPLDNLTHEQFARRYAEHGNATRAYRECFSVAASTSAATVTTNGYQLVHQPEVAARVRALLAIAAETTLISTRARLVTLQRIVESDPTSVVSISGNCCRHCHGVGHGYQWRNAIELCRAIDAYGASINTPKPLPMPDGSGGYGFRGDLKPHPECPKCFGDGLVRVRITPTDELSPTDRAAIKSIRQKGNGEIEVHFHDKMQAADMLNKVAGVYVDRSINANVNVDLTPASRDEAMALLAKLAPVQP
jgi:phage terminase small subunit